MDCLANYINGYRYCECRQMLLLAINGRWVQQNQCSVTAAEAESSGFSGIGDPFKPWPDINDVIEIGEVCDL